MSTTTLTSLCIILIALLTACAPTPAPVAQAPATVVPPSETPVPTDTPTPTVDATATQSIQLTAAAQAADEADAAATSAQQTEVMTGKRAAATSTAGVKHTATARVMATTVAKMVGFQLAINKLYEEGKLQSKEGDYYSLDDFEASEARINTPFVQLTNYSAVDFVISSDLVWESASDHANWPTSGCGYVYGYKDRYNADLTFLGLDGYTHSLQFRQNKPMGVFAFMKWGDPERPNGKAKATLAVSDKHVYVYVDDQLANEFYNSLYVGGEIGLNVFSGTNAGFGTRCHFSNLQLMILK